MDKEKYISKAKMREEPKKPSLKFKLVDRCIKNKHIDDDAVDTRIIKDNAVTPEKLSNSVKPYIINDLDSKYDRVSRSIDEKYTNITNELYSMVASLQVGGIALSQQFGDRTDIGISQKTLTKILGRILDELGLITHKTYMDFILTVIPTKIISETGGSVNVKADCTEAISDFDNIKVYRDDELVAESSDIEIYEVTVPVTQTSVIKVVGTIMGKAITKQQTVYKLYPFFIGGGSAYQDVLVPECQKELVGTLEGDYDVTIKHTGDYMFIIIPVSHKDEFRRADMNGLGLKVEIPMASVEYADYVVYKSLNTYKAGTYNIDIDINS